MTTRFKHFRIAGNRLAAAANWRDVEAAAFGGRYREAMEAHHSAYLAFTAALDTDKTATPAPAPVINPSHYPDPISYLNRCRHFKRVMILMERGSDEYAWRHDWSGMTAYALARVTTYYTAADAYANCVADAMSLSLPYNPLPPGPAPDGMPF